MEDPRVEMIPESYIVRVFTRIREGLFDGSSASSQDVWGTLLGWWEIYSIVALILSALFFIGFIYAKIKYGQLMAMLQQELRDAEVAWAHTYGGAVARDARWDDIQSHVTTDNPNDWRLAIIEADIMLEEVLEKAGYVGATIGDRLKSASAQPFQTLEDAWEAHKVRNRIAHSGSDFVLTQKAAQETITRFERVFREFDVI